MNAAHAVSQTVSLVELREEIDDVDRSLLRALAQRIALVRRIAALKADSTLPSRDPAREARILAHARIYAGHFGVAPQSATDLMTAVLGVCWADAYEKD